MSVKFEGEPPPLRIDDAKGDRIVTDWPGAQGPEGGQGSYENGGATGKYVAIPGNGPWQCKDAGADDQLNCTPRLESGLL